MSSKADIEGGLDEMDFSIVDNGLIEVPCSKPAAFSFRSTPTLDADAFRAEIDGYDFGVARDDCDEKDDGQFYCHFRIVTDHYKEVSVKVWPESVRIFPREEGLDTFEFARIVHAIEDAFGAELEHDPIEEDGQA